MTVNQILRPTLWRKTPLEQLKDGKEEIQHFKELEKQI